MDIKHGPRVLIFDLETAPMVSYHWRMWKENIGLAQKISNSFLLCWAAKWLDEPTVMTGSIWDDGGDVSTGDDKNTVQALVSLVEKADYVVAHNAKRFDVPVLKTRMLQHGMSPLPPHKVVDTLVIAKKEFKFASNSLDSVAEFLNCSRKINTGGFSLWRGVMEGCPEAESEMLEYNIQDVVMLEEVYKKLRAWDSRSPNAALYYPNAVPRCGCCGSKDLSVLGKQAATSLSLFPAIRCNGCGKIMRSAQNLKTKEQRTNILRNVV